MGMFDTILGQVSDHPDIGNLAAKLGLDQAMTEKAIAALGMTHQQPGDTAELAAAKTGLDLSTIQSLIAHIGGEGSLGEFANQIMRDPGQYTILFDKDGDGSGVDELTDMAKGLFGKA